MKYILEIDINLPRNKVLELYQNPDKMKHWQDGLISFEHLEGTPRRLGSRSKLVYKIGRRKTELIETISVSNLPNELSAIYETEGLWNQTRNYFQDKNSTSTKWILETEFKGIDIIMKSMLFFIPGSFKKQSWKFMTAFKKYAESTDPNK